MSPQDRIVLALDCSDAATALATARRLRGQIGLVKVGLELFAAAGPAVVRQLRAEGVEVFLDLKLHDIPNTVAGAVTAASDLGVRMLTLHAAGGAKMLAAAAAAARAFTERTGRPAPLLLAVTVLTSLGQEELAQLGIPGTPAERVLAWAAIAQAAGVDGVVASVQEAAALRAAFGPKLVLVTPGIRPAGAASGDQARVATPAEAVRAGADYLVIGRAVTAAADPAAALGQILAETAAAAKLDAAVS